MTAIRPDVAPAIERLGTPPGSLPVEAVRQTVRRHRAGVASDHELVAQVDRHGAVLETEIARRAVQHYGAIIRTVRRLQALHDWLALTLAQDRWLRSFPSGVPIAAEPLAVEYSGGLVPVPQLLDALTGLELDQRLVAIAATSRGHHDARRGAAASMAAIAEAGVSSTDVALELGISRSKAWAILAGRQTAPAELEAALSRLVGPDHAQVVLSGIPGSPRARRAPSAAVRALHAAGASTEDVAALIPCTPQTVRRWLRGTLRPPPTLGPALEQLLGPGRAGQILALIPPVLTGASGKMPGSAA